MTNPTQSKKFIRTTLAALLLLLLVGFAYWWVRPIEDPTPEHSGNASSGSPR